MENVNIYSPINDPQIKTELQNSPIWNKAYTEEEYRSNSQRYQMWFIYSIKFDGLKPKQVTNVKKVSN